MQSTSNYSMNLVEGTDIVNIPVQLNPNFQTIDGAMFDNKQASVGTATEVVTGTSHAIVRSNPDSDVFRFTATGAWTAGDTMSVDGNSVTVHLSDGTVPPSGAYIIGAEVLAVINGALVTLMIGMTPPAQGVTSFNSRTGAVTPQASDYDAGMIDYDNTLSGLTSTDVQSAIDELKTLIPSIDLGFTRVACNNTIEVTSNQTTVPITGSLPAIFNEYFVEFSIAGGTYYTAIMYKDGRNTLLAEFGNSLYQVLASVGFNSDKTALFSNYTTKGSSMTSYPLTINAVHVR